jgi:hypothetical protein
MLSEIALIASGISAVTAITTSLRALGRVNEDSRAGEFKKPYTMKDKKILRPYCVVTLIWLMLSMVFAVPVVLRRSGNFMVIYGGFLLIAVILVGLIWYHILRKGH